MKPNIIFILIDDMGWRDLGCYGSSFYETPNIDALAAGGMQFTDAYAACPVCSPTRASIMTGKYPARVGITNYIGGHESGKLVSPPYLRYLPLNEVTIARALKGSGYCTYHVGKWHLGDEPFWPEHHGFDVNIGGCEWGNPKQGYFFPYGMPGLENGPEGEYLTDRLTSEAIKLLEAHARSRDPFFLHMSHYAVHTPIQAPRELVDKYRQKMRELGLDKVKTFEEGDPFPTREKKDQRIKRRLVQSDPAYAAMIENLDWNIGRLMDALDRLGMIDNTIVFFFSDNGGLATAESSPTCNYPLSEGKGWMYEGGTRDPLIIKWPGVIPAGSRCSVPVTSTDFYPTMLEMAGLPLMPEQHVDGVSLLPLFSGDDGAKLERDVIFWHYPHYGNQGGTPGTSLRSGAYKLIEFLEDNHLELYNLEEDIGEHEDISEEHPRLVKELKQLLDGWRKDVNAIIPDKNVDYPYYLYPHFVSITGPLSTDEDGLVCLTMQIHRNNPNLFQVPISEIIDHYLDTNILLQIGTSKEVGMLEINENGCLEFVNREKDTRLPFSQKVNACIGNYVLLRAWKLLESELLPGIDVELAIQVKVVEDPAI